MKQQHYWRASYTDGTTQLYFDLDDIEESDTLTVIEKINSHSINVNEIISLIEADLDNANYRGKITDIPRALYIILEKVVGKEIGTEVLRVMYNQGVFSL
jgi:hypothetical protein